MEGIEICVSQHTHKNTRGAKKSVQNKKRDKNYRSQFRIEGFYLLDKKVPEIERAFSSATLFGFYFL